MRFYLSLCLLLSIQQKSEAQQKFQQNKIDSLKRGLASASGKNRLAFLAELNLAYRDSSYDVALDYANQYYKLALTLGDSVQIVKGGRMQAYTLMDLGKNDQAIKILLISLGIAQRNAEKFPEQKKQIKFILNNIGLAYTFLAEYDKALDMQFQSLKIREEEGDTFQIIRCLNNIGLIFFNLEDYERGLQNFLRADRLCQETNEKGEQQKVLINLGLCYIDLDDPKKGIIAIEKALSICGSTCSETIMMECQQGLGVALYDLKEYSKSKQKFSISYEIAKKLKETRYVCEDLENLGRIEIELGNVGLGISKFKAGLKLAESNKLTKNRIFLYERLSEVYQKQKDYKNSLFFLKKYKQLKDSVYSSTLIKNLAKIQTDFAERENVKVIKAKDQILQLNRELIQKQWLQTILIGAVAGLLLILTAVLYKFYRNKLQINIRLDQKVKERTEEFRQNNRSLIDINEMQRSLLQKIERDGQSITSRIKGLCHVAQLGAIESGIKECFKKVDENADELLLLFKKKG
jgi:tetratricopeptide (TPR) repeat protein